jgi:hypothetical protein
MIPTLKDWTDGTAVFGRFRSDELKAVDRAITAYQAERNEANRNVVGAAWSHWKYVHVSTLKTLVANKRNSKNLFALLDAEFNLASTATPTIGAISRWKLTFPDTRPPGFANIDDTSARARIDMAIVDAQSVLQVVNERLRRADSDTVAQVRQWFGTTPLADLRERFAKLGEKAGSGFKGDTPLEVQWSTNASETAATGNNAKWMKFGTPFFDDNKTFSGIKLGGRPAAPASHITELRAIAASYADGPKQTKAMLAEVAVWLEKPGATLGECADKVFARRTMSFPSLKAMMGPALAAGFTAAMSKADAARKLASAEAANSATVGALNTRYLEIVDLKCTASGTIIHELTHMLFNTEDHASPLSPSMKCYGVALCSHLASVDPAMAFSNADNYRLFAECCQM